MKLIPEVKEKWLIALRGDEYVQGKGFLRAVKKGESQVHYCCLGVLTELQGCKTAGVTEEVFEADDEDDVFQVDATQYAFDEHHECVGQPTAWWMAQLMSDHEYGLMDVNGAINDLVSMNDSGKSFPEIANWIEENL